MRKRFCGADWSHPNHQWARGGPGAGVPFRCPGVKPVAVGAPVVLGTGTKYRIKAIVKGLATVRATHPVREKTVTIDELRWDKVAGLWRQGGA